MADFFDVVGTPSSSTMEGRNTNGGVFRIPLTRDPQGGDAALKKKVAAIQKFMEQCRQTSRSELGMSAVLSTSNSRHEPNSSEHGSESILRPATLQLPDHHHTDSTSKTATTDARYYCTSEQVSADSTTMTVLSCVAASPPPLSRASVASSPPSSPSSTSTTSPPLPRQQPIATPPPSQIVPYHLVDVEVMLKPGYHDIMLKGKVGVVSNITASIATVRIRDNSSDISIPHDSLVPVPPRPMDTVKVIGGSNAVLGLIGTLISILYQDGVVQFLTNNRARAKNSAQIPLSQLGRYSPKPQFPPCSSLPAPPTGFSFPKKLGVIDNKKTSANTATTTATATSSRSGPLGLGGLGVAPSAQAIAYPFLVTSISVFPPQVSLPGSVSSVSRFPAGTTTIGTNTLSFPFCGSPAGVQAMRDGPMRDSVRPMRDDVRPDSTTTTTTTTSSDTTRRLRGIVTGSSPQVNPAMIPLCARLSNRGDLVLSKRGGGGSESVGQPFRFPRGLMGNLAAIGGLQGNSGSHICNMKEELEKLVRNQRHYPHQLASPTTPEGGSSVSHDIKTSCVRVSLVCPLSQQRMKYPSRGKFCKHLQCFDAENYIKFHEKQMTKRRLKQVGSVLVKQQVVGKKWICPICEKTTEIHHLYIDKALMKLVQETDASEVELDKGSTWVPVKKHPHVEVIDLTGD